MPVQRTVATHKAARGGAKAGRGSRGRGSGRGGGTAAASRSRYVPYSDPAYPSTATKTFFGGAQGHANTDTSFDGATLEAMKQDKTVKKIVFDARFPINDQHLETLASHSDICSRLEYISLGDSDTGNGVWVSDKSVKALAAACPNLVVLLLCSCTQIKQDTVIAVLEYCSKLERLWVTGHDKSQGKIKPKTLLKALADRQDLAPNLRELALYDQNGDLGMGGDKSITNLSKKRSKLAIMTGETVGDGFTDCFIAMNTGGGLTSTIHNGKVVDMDVGY